MIDLRQGDCLALMQELDDESIDCIICDPPYGMTRCEWDVVIPPEDMWTEFNRVIKPNGAICVFAKMPFALDLIAPNRKNFRYEIIWDKGAPVGWLNAKKRPLCNHETIYLFYKQQPTYNPQFTYGTPYKRKNAPARTYGDFAPRMIESHDGKRYPKDIVTFSNCIKRGDMLQATQKPVPLLEWLVKTYTNPGEKILDPTMGSGTTGIACINTGREFIGMEKDEINYAQAKERIIKRMNEKQAEEISAGAVLNRRKD